jgi:hypothetical protein
LLVSLNDCAAEKTKRQPNKGLSEISPVAASSLNMKYLKGVTQTLGCISAAAV